METDPSMKNVVTRPPSLRCDSVAAFVRSNRDIGTSGLVQAPPRQHRFATTLVSFHSRWKVSGCPVLRTREFKKLINPAPTNNWSAWKWIHRASAASSPKVSIKFPLSVCGHKAMCLVGRKSCKPRLKMRYRLYLIWTKPHKTRSGAADQARPLPIACLAPKPLLGPKAEERDRQDKLLSPDAGSELSTYPRTG